MRTGQKVFTAVNKAADLSKLDVLDCTLRDGSYVIDYRFTLEDAILITVGLQQSGVRWIEVGHGLGVGAHARDKTKHLMSDTTYLEILRPVVRRSRLGVFCIPGIATLKDLKAAARAGAAFVRIGTDIDSVGRAEEFIREGKSNGLMVAANFMKSYACDAEFFLAQCEKVQRWGADLAYLVDSAGGMLPEEVGHYIRTTRASCSIPLGFHGHNNLNLGVGNCLAAMEAGAVLLDATLQGMGRSAGNTQLESLVAVLQKKKHLGHVDLFKLLDLGQNVVRPMMKNRSGVSKMGTVLGRSRFHSSFLPMVAEKLTTKDRRRLLPKLLMKIGEEGIIKVVGRDVSKALNTMEKEKVSGCSFDAGDLDLLSPVLLSELGQKKYPGWRGIGSVLERMASLKHKTGKRTVLAVSGSFSKSVSKTRFPFIRESGSCVIGLAEPGSKADASRIFGAADGRVDLLMVDRDHDSSRRLKLLKLARQCVRQTPVYVYRDLEAWSAGVAQMAHELGPKRVWVMGEEDLTILLKAHLVPWKLKAELCGPKDTIGPGELIILSFLSGVKHLPKVKASAMVVDATALSLRRSAGLFQGRSMRVHRFDGRTGLAAEVESVLMASDFRKGSVGVIPFKNFMAVSGGVLGQKGDVVLDSFGPSSRIVGVADGKGGFIDESAARQYRERLSEVLRFLVDQKLNALSSWEE